MELIRDLDNWRRAGGGRTLQFFATDTEVQEWLLDCIPREYLPCRLVGADLEPRGSPYVQKPFVWELDELQRSVAMPGNARDMFFIWSATLTPGLFDASPDDFSKYCSLNGLVVLQHGSVRGHMREASTLMIVDRVRDQRTGIIREHLEYRRIYNSLARCVKRALCYSTVHRFKDGSEEEDAELRLMTEQAAQAYQEGFPFRSAPCRRLHAWLPDKK